MTTTTALQFIGLPRLGAFILDTRLMAQDFSSLIGMQLWLPLFVAACLGGLATYTWQFREEPGARWQVYGFACKAAWLLALVFAQTSSGLEPRLRWISVYQMLTYLLSYFWYRFIAEISGFEQQAPKWLTHVLGGSVLLFWLIILTNSWHGWYRKSAWMVGAEIWIVSGPVIHWARLAAYLLNALSVGINVRWAIQRVGLRRRQAAWFLLPSLIGWFGHYLTILPGSRVFAPLPSAFLFSSIVTVWAFERWRMYSVLPLAQQQVVKTMIDGLMIVDEADYIVGMNPTAKATFGKIPVVEGAPFQVAARAWRALDQLGDCEDVASIETDRQVEGSARTYRVTRTSLRASTGHRLGKVLVFKDVTLEKRQQSRIIEQQKSLSMLAERERLGRELHDGPGQIWSFISMQAQAAQTMMANRNFAQAELHLARLIEVVKEVHVGLRESINGLQTDVSGDQGLIEALGEQLNWYRQHCDLQAELLLRCDWRPGMLPPSTEAHALRIVQEALANVRKSAQASRVQVILESDNLCLRITIEDDGCGFDPAQLLGQTGHHGLTMMRDRAQEIGARLTLDSKVGGGTRVGLELLLAPCTDLTNEGFKYERVAGR